MKAITIPVEILTDISKRLSSETAIATVLGLRTVNLVINPSQHNLPYQQGSFLLIASYYSNAIWLVKVIANKRFNTVAVFDSQHSPSIIQLIKSHTSHLTIIIE